MAILLTRNGKPARLWAHRPEHIEALRSSRRNARYLPNAELPDALELTADLETALSSQDIIIAVPSHAFRSTLRAIATALRPGQRVAWATKGLEQHTHKLLHQLADEILAEVIPTAVISGPSFAREVAAGLPTAVTVASRDAVFAQQLAERLHDEAFRAYTSEDIVGVEVGGAVKNVLAIAAGIGDGLGFGANARAALITRGLAEITRLGVALGAQPQTFTGLAGLGDLVLTCTDDQSRNRRFGLAIARGRSTREAHAEIGQVVEGEHTAHEVWQMSQQRAVEMPICTEVYRVVYEDLDPHEAVHNLMGRRQKAEYGSSSRLRMPQP